MRKGLVLGKFMPLHKGHIQLIEFALKKCDKLVVLLCVEDKEPISGETRYKWLKEYFNRESNLEIVFFKYSEKDLPNTSESSRAVSYLWAKELKRQFADIECFISSEPYGKYVAEYMGIEAVLFDVAREQMPVSGSDIRANPYHFWNYLPDVVKKFYYRKVCVVGTESVGKSVLVERLSKYFNSDFVSEAGREIVSVTEECTFSDLEKIAIAHATHIINKDRELNKILFVDTDVFITKSYAKFLFNKELKVSDRILAANRFHLHLYLESDAPFVQDGTRLSFDERNKLDISHKKEFRDQQIPYISISGNWEERFQQSVKAIKQEFNIT